jgi:tetratricopeptide (TPR) repeat protein
MGRCFNFDDGSTFVLDGTLDAAFEIAFGECDPERIEEVVLAAVDYFWLVQRVPDKRGNEHPWEQRFSSKQDLTPAVLQPILNSQCGTIILGLEKYNLIIVDPDDGKSRTYKGKEALEKSNEYSLNYLGGFATKGLFMRGMAFVQQGRMGDARDVLERAVEFDEEFGQAWFWLGIVLQKQGENPEARRAFPKAAKLLQSPHFGKVACPSCGWIPSGEPMWKCDGCGERFDTFATRAKCPKCAKTHDTTSCIACKERPPHPDWWK